MYSVHVCKYVHVCNIMYVHVGRLGTHMYMYVCVYVILCMYVHVGRLGTHYTHVYVCMCVRNIMHVCTCR